jgi:hypothetical protein
MQPTDRATPTARTQQGHWINCQENTKVRSQENMTNWTSVTGNPSEAHHIQHHILRHPTHIFSPTPGKRIARWSVLPITPLDDCNPRNRATMLMRATSSSTKNPAKMILAVLHCSKFLLLPLLPKLLNRPKSHRKIAGAKKSSTYLSRSRPHTKQKQSLFVHKSTTKKTDAYMYPCHRNVYNY